MHEWGIAESIVRAVLEYAEGEGIKRVWEVVISVGELSQLDLEVLRYAAETLSKGTPLEGAVFKFDEEEARFKCNRCGWEWGFEDIKSSIEEKVGVRVRDLEGGNDLPIHYMPELIYTYASCPKCGSSDFEVVSGMGVKIVRLRVDE
mgnify:FL=1